MNIALVIIDMQNDFVLPEAPLCVKGAQATVPTIQKLLDRARAEGWRVIHVIRQHRRDGSDVEIGRAPLFTQGAGICVPGTKGAEIVDELAPLPDETILRKLRFSAFFQTELDMILRRLKIDTLLIAGTQYPNCVRGTATDAMSHDYNTIVVTRYEKHGHHLRHAGGTALHTGLDAHRYAAERELPPLGFLAQRGKTAHAHGVAFSDTFFQQELPPRRLPTSQKSLGG